MQLVVSGAGTAAVNATYNVVGMRDGQQLWKSGAGYYVFWSTAQVNWFIDLVPNDLNVGLYNRGGSMITGGPWYVGTGVAPGPDAALV